MMERPEFLEPYREGMETVVLALKESAQIIRKSTGREVINTVKARIKSPESIAAKLRKKGGGITLANARAKLNDLAGVRVTSYFLDDLYSLAGAVRGREDMAVVKEKDYIRSPKASGYRSLHLIVQVPVLSPFAGQVKVEIQLRTVAMDFWAGLDHELCYKKNLTGAEQIMAELKKYAGVISGLDRNMLELRKRIEAM